MSSVDRTERSSIVRLEVGRLTGGKRLRSTDEDTRTFHPEPCFISKIHEGFSPMSLKSGKKAQGKHESSKLLNQGGFTPTSLDLSLI